VWQQQQQQLRPAARQRAVLGGCAEAHAPLVLSRVHPCHSAAQRSIPPPPASLQYAESVIAAAKEAGAEQLVLVAAAPSGIAAGTGGARGGFSLFGGARPATSSGGDERLSRAEQAAAASGMGYLCIRAAGLDRWAACTGPARPWSACRRVRRAQQRRRTISSPAPRRRPNPTRPDPTRPRRVTDRYSDTNNVVVGRAGSLPPSLAVSGAQVAGVLAAALQQAAPRRGYVLEVGASGGAPYPDLESALGDLLAQIDSERPDEPEPELARAAAGLFGGLGTLRFKAAAPREQEEEEEEVGVGLCCWCCAGPGANRHAPA
jgi:hypothetical protein